MARSRDAKHELGAEVERGGWIVARCTCGKWSDMAKADEAFTLMSDWLGHLVKGGKLKAKVAGVCTPACSESHTYRAGCQLEVTGSAREADDDDAPSLGIAGEQ